MGQCSVKCFAQGMIPQATAPAPPGCLLPPNPFLVGALINEVPSLAEPGGGEPSRRRGSATGGAPVGAGLGSLQPRSRLPDPRDLPGGAGAGAGAGRELRK